MEGIMTFWSQILYALSNIRIFDIIDIVAISYIIYKAIGFFRETRAGILVKGIAILLVVFVCANWFNLVSLKWLLLKLADSVLVVAVIVFQPELRRLLERVGRSNIGVIGKSRVFQNDEQINVISDVCKSVGNMQEKKIGALIVFERRTPLGEIIDTGTLIDAEISTELVQNVFFPKSPLHDGAMIIRGTRIVSAGCILPLTANNDINSQLGTRHRAAIGMSESSDAVVLIVSEETGIISVAKNGVITRGYTPITLREELCAELLVPETDEKPFYIRWYDKFLVPVKERIKNGGKANED